VKGGDTATDILVRGFGETVFRSAPVRRDPTHHRGTGCRLASALAAHLAQGEIPERAIRRARALVLEFLSTPIMPPAVEGPKRR
jgi:hydroxymethylpyrimidine/phosphomethylpyrimidine kinase